MTCKWEEDGLYAFEASRGRFRSSDRGRFFLPVFPKADQTELGRHEPLSDEARHLHEEVTLDEEESIEACNIQLRNLCQ